MIVYRLVKGAPLTITELDDNFHDVDDRVTFIEENPPEARGIDEITAVGNTLIILYTDSTEDTVAIPIATLRGRGDWAPSTEYLVNDTVQYAGVVYVVPTTHTSALTFDPGANDGEGHDFYSPLFDLPALSLPVGGGTGYVLTKVSDTDYDYQWVKSAFPLGGDAGDIVVKLSADDYDYEWQSAGSLTSATVIAIALADLTITSTFYANKYIRCTADEGCVVTFLPDDAIELPLGTEIHFRQCGAGGVTLEGTSSDGDVTLNSITGYLTETAVLGAVITAKKIGTDEWDVWGLLAADTSDSV